MAYKQKRYGLSHRSVVGLLILAILLSFTGVFVLGHTLTEAVAPKPVIMPPVISQFSFTGASDWTQGPSNNTSMALFESGGDCFVSIQLKTGVVDAPSELQKQQALLTTQGYTVTQGPTKSISIQTSSGNQHYTLYQSSVATPAGDSDLEGGQEFGYLQLSTSYLYLQGYCNTASQLPGTISALEAFRFDPSKATTTK
jgi:hypothetical protein